jgi:hypothetical protein
VTLAGALVNVVAGVTLLSWAWCSSDRTTRRLWQWSIWLLGCAAFGCGLDILIGG